MGKQHYEYDYRENIGPISTMPMELYCNTTCTRMFVDSNSQVDVFSFKLCRDIVHIIQRSHTSAYNTIKTSQLTMKTCKERIKMTISSYTMWRHEGSIFNYSQNLKAYLLSLFEIRVLAGLQQPFCQKCRQILLEF